MSFLRIRINYNSNENVVYSRLFNEVLKTFVSNDMTSWSLNKGWEYGPHFNLLINKKSHFFSQDLVNTVQSMIESFIKEFPSENYDKDAYVEKQKQLKKIENKELDHEVVFDNNSLSVDEVTLSNIYKKFENEAQMESVFNAECQLSSYIIKMRANDEQPLDIALKVMLMTACTFSPHPSPLPEVDEYNGFLSFKANYKFWLHGLNEEDKSYIESKFSEKYSEYIEVINEFLLGESSRSTDFSKSLNELYLYFTEMAEQGYIHERSPHPLEMLKPKEELSGFHQSLFYNDDGSVYRFPHIFSGYRWLMNIVYKNLPFIGCSAMDRQFLNYALFNFDDNNRSLISQFRESIKIGEFGY